MISRIPACVFCAFLFVSGTGYSDSIDSVSTPPTRCGTLEALSLSHARGKVASRPILTNSVLSSAGHFLVHYNTTGSDAPASTDSDLNGIPDYVDSTLIYLEYAWTLEVTTLGYNAPRNDAGGDGGNEIDVYLANLGNKGWYGVTYSDNDSSGAASAYIVIDNDFLDSLYCVTRGYAALKVTTAHEFFHVVQFGYSTSDALGWWMEQTATWMEDQAWSTVNDYLAYLYYFFVKYAKATPLDTANGAFEYGAVVWPTYLASRFGNGIIRSSWEKAGQNPLYPYTDMSSFLNPLIIAADASATFSSALHEFSVWNFFTGSRAPTGQFYIDGSKFAYSVSMSDTLNTVLESTSLSTVYLTSNYVEILFTGSWGESNAVKIKTVTSTTNRKHKSSLIFYNSPTDFLVTPLADSVTTVALGKHWTKAVIVTTCVNSRSVSGYCTVTADTVRSITATAPNGGETWIGGTTRNITWTGAGITNVTIEYSTNNGSTWSTIQTGLSASMGSYAWTVPNEVVNACLVRVSDTDDPSVTDTSNASFSIVPNSETVYIATTAPNGGEMWFGGTTRNITWTSANVTNVTIEYSTNNGSTWSTIQTGLSASMGSYAWTVPNKVVNACLVRVVNADDTSVADVSDASFSIAPSTFQVRGVFPNPFNPTTTIRFFLPEKGTVRTTVYDALGRKVANLSEESFDAGENQLLWKPENLANGVYLVRVTTPFGSQTTRAILLK